MCIYIYIILGNKMKQLAERINFKNIQANHATQWKQTTQSKERANGYKEFFSKEHIHR